MRTWNAFMHPGYRFPCLLNSKPGGWTKPDLAVTVCPQRLFDAMRAVCDAAKTLDEQWSEEGALESSYVYLRETVQAFREIAAERQEAGGE